MVSFSLTFLSWLIWLMLNMHVRSHPKTPPCLQLKLYSDERATDNLTPQHLRFGRIWRSLQASPLPQWGLCDSDWHEFLCRCLARGRTFCVKKVCWVIGSNIFCPGKTGKTSHWTWDEVYLRMMMLQQRFRGSRWYRIFSMNMRCSNQMDRHPNSKSNCWLSPTGVSSARGGARTTRISRLHVPH